MFNTSTFSESTYQYLAWYNDVTHEIRPVTSGVRLVLTYNLRLKDPGSDDISSSDASESGQARIKNALQDWQGAATYPSKPYFLTYILEHQYSQKSLSYGGLKGNDHVRAKVLKGLCEELGFKIYLALLERHYGGAVDQDEDGYDSYDSNASIMSDVVTGDELALKNVTTLDGEPHSANLPITEFDIVQEDPFNRIPDKKDYSGPTGNEGVTIDYW
jgi:hypothetical protein